MVDSEEGRTSGNRVLPSFFSLFLLIVFGKLAEFDEDTVRGFGMNESDFCVVSAGSGFLVDQRRSLLKIGLHLCLDIIDLKTDVMDPLAFGF